VESEDGVSGRLAVAAASRRAAVAGSVREAPGRDGVGEAAGPGGVGEGSGGEEAARPAAAAGRRERGSSVGE
jgi:hypothetical protein